MLHFFYKKVPVVLDQHISSEKLCALANGKVSPLERVLIADHLRKCTRCHVMLTVARVRR
jgi:anti-sigma factor ChrR (cupin superfamily)